VLEYQREGSLLGKVYSSVEFTESQVKFIMLQLLLSIDFLNKRDLIHRDLKIDNVLINKISPEGDYYVKVADFGLATVLPGDGSFIYDVCGTPTYIAPEILKKEGYREKCDIFSLGSIMFNLLSGRYLFNGANSEDILNQNMAC
jgi:serine/threonine protein kinase